MSSEDLRLIDVLAFSGLVLLPNVLCLATLYHLDGWLPVGATIIIIKCCKQCPEI